MGGRSRFGARVAGGGAWVPAPGLAVGNACGVGAQTMAWDQGTRCYTRIRGQTFVALHTPTQCPFSLGRGGERETHHSNRVRYLSGSSAPLRVWQHNRPGALEVDAQLSGAPPHSTTSNTRGTVSPGSIQAALGNAHTTQGAFSHSARTARAQRAHSANYYGDSPGNNPENHPPAESCTINSKLKNSNI